MTNISIVTNFGKWFWYQNEEKVPINMWRDRLRIWDFGGNAIKSGYDFDEEETKGGKKPDN